MNAPNHPIGAGRLPSPSDSPTEAAGAPNRLTPTQPCLSCSGEGEAEIMGLTDTQYHWEECNACEGTGKARRPYCEVCQSSLTVDGFCYSCDDWGVAPRIAPLPEGWSRVAL